MIDNEERIIDLGTITKKRARINQTLFIDVLLCRFVTGRVREVTILFAPGAHWLSALPT